MDKRKDGQGLQRRKISFHIFRSFVKSTVAIHTNSDFSEYLIGHSHSTYWNISEHEKRQLYLKCMKYLTFLDYATVESVGQDFESKLEERDKIIEQLRQNFRKMFMKQRELEMKYENKKK